MGFKVLIPNLIALNTYLGFEMQPAMDSIHNIQAAVKQFEFTYALKLYKLNSVSNFLSHYIFY